MLLGRLSISFKPSRNTVFCSRSNPIDGQRSFAPSQRHLIEAREALIKKREIHFVRSQASIPPVQTLEPSLMWKPLQQLKSSCLCPKVVVKPRISFASSVVFQPTRESVACQNRKSRNGGPPSRRRFYRNEFPLLPPLPAKVVCDHCIRLREYDDRFVHLPTLRKPLTQGAVQRFDTVYAITGNKRDAQRRQVLALTNEQLSAYRGYKAYKKDWCW